MFPFYSFICLYFMGGRTIENTRLFQMQYGAPILDQRPHHRRASPPNIEFGRLATAAIPALLTRILLREIRFSPFALLIIAFMASIGFVSPRIIRL
jgi:hypothetical protein